MCSNWYPSLIYKSYSILCYMFCFSWVCNLPKKRMSNSYMFKNIWKKRVKIWVYLLWLNAFISKVTQLSIIVAFYFGLILVSIPLTSSLFFFISFLWSQISNCTTMFSLSLTLRLIILSLSHMGDKCNVLHLKRFTSNSLW